MSGRAAWSSAEGKVGWGMIEKRSLTSGYRALFPLKINYKWMGVYPLAKGPTLAFGAL